MRRKVDCRFSKLQHLRAQPRDFRFLLPDATAQFFVAARMVILQSSRPSLATRASGHKLPSQG